MKFSFKCTETGKCIHKASEPDNNTLYECQNACRLTCGRYGALWPRPTGSTIIKNTVVHLNPRNIRYEIFMAKQKDNVWWNVTIIKPCRFEHRTTNTNDQEYLNIIDGIFLKNIVRECEKKLCFMESENEVVIQYAITTFDDTLTWETDESYNLAISTLGQLYKQLF